MFYGILIRMFFNDHAPPHFHARYGEFEATIDIGTSGCDSLEEVFEQSEAFAWLTENAAQYRFAMSFPRDNAYGYRHEPWHWAYREA